MTDTVRTVAALQALLADGATANGTNRQLLRDMLVSLDNEVTVEGTARNTAIAQAVATEATNRTIADNAEAVVRALFDTNIGGINVKNAPYNAVGDGVTDDTAAIQAAINTGKPVFFPRSTGDYCAVGLTQSADAQSLIAQPGTVIRKNGNGVILTSTGNDVQLNGLLFKGVSASFTGDNVNFSGARCGMVLCGSQDAAGRAVKATGDAFQIRGGQVGAYSTADATATGYDIEIGVSGTATLYHELIGVYTSQNTGGILLTDVGEHMILGGEFGKLYIKKGTGPAGTGGGKTIGARILNAITVELSGATLAHNHRGANATVTFAAGTSGCEFLELTNSAGAAVTNNGTLTSNLILRNMGTGASGTIQMQYGDDTTYCILEITPAASGSGTLKAPKMRIVNNQNYNMEQATAPGTIGATIGMSSIDFLSFANLVTGTGMAFTVTGTTSGSRYQWAVGGTNRMVVDNSGIRHGSTSAPFSTSGSGSPEGVVTAIVGSLYLRTDGGANTTLYVKESGASNTGWIAK